MSTSRSKDCVKRLHRQRPGWPRRTSTSSQISYEVHFAHSSRACPGKAQLRNRHAGLAVHFGARARYAKQNALDRNPVKSTVAAVVELTACAWTSVQQESRPGRAEKARSFAHLLRSRCSCNSTPSVSPCSRPGKSNNESDLHSTVFTPTVPAEVSGAHRRRQGAWHTLALHLIQNTIRSRQPGRRRGSVYSVPPPSSQLDSSLLISGSAWR